MPDPFPAAPEQAELLVEARRVLRGHDLACWCNPGDPFHVDVLLRLVNEPPKTQPDA